MGRYAQAKRRGADRADRLPNLPSLVAFAVDLHTLGWNADEEPATWVIEGSADEAGPFVYIDEIPGFEAQYDTIDGGLWYRVIGHDVDGQPTTQYSNAVFLVGP